MKKILLLFIIVLPLFSLSQSKNAIDTAAEKMCDYMNKHTDKKIATMSDAVSYFTEAFVEVCMPMMERLMENEGLTDLDENTGKQIGQKIGIKLAIMCPRYMNVIMPLIKGEAAEGQTGTLSGIVSEVKQDGYTFLKIKSPDGTEKRVVWLMFFEEAESINNDPQKLVGKKVDIEWKSVQLYYSKSNSFGIEKMITGFTQK